MKIEQTNNSKEYLKFLESKTIRNASVKFPNIAFNNKLLIKEDSRALRPYFGFSSKVLTVFFILFFSILSLDLASKWWIETNLVQKEKSSEVAESKGDRVYLHPENDFFFVEDIAIVEPFLKISYTRNFNIGFSALKSLEEAVGLQMIFVIVLALQTLVMILLSIFFVMHFSNCYIPFAFILAGGAGNIIDRSMRGYVVDFVELRIPWGNISLFDPWPIFNVADVSVTIGAILLSAYFFLGKIETNP